MATNTLAPNGFNFGGRSLLANSPNYAIRTFRIAYNNANKIAKGDPVKLLSSGYIDLMASGGTTILGILDGCEYFDPTRQQFVFSPHWNAIAGLPAGANVTARVVVDPNYTFIAQMNGGPATIASEGLNVDIKSNTSGVPSLAGISTCSLDFSTVATTATLPFRIINVVSSGMFATYDPNGANNWVEVKMNTQNYTQTTGI